MLRWSEDMLEGGLVTTIEEIATNLRERRSQGKPSVIFLGARAGEFYGNDDFYQALKQYIPEFHNLNGIKKFISCYEALSSHYKEPGIHHILTTILENSKYRQEDEFLAELIRMGFSDLIITTIIGTLLEHSFIPE